MSCFTGCDVNSRTAPRWVTGDLMLTVIRTLGGKCYTAMFPGVVLSHSLAAMSLWLRSLEAENQTDGDVFVFKRCKSVFCVFTARPCRWKVKAVGVKDASALICLLPGGPEREKRRTLTILGCTKQAFLTPWSTCLCLGCSEPDRGPEFTHSPGVSQDIENTAQGTEQCSQSTGEDGTFSSIFPLNM